MTDTGDRAQASRFLTALAEHASALREEDGPDGKSLDAAGAAALRRELQHVEWLVRKIHLRYPDIAMRSPQADPAAEAGE